MAAALLRSSVGLTLRRTAAASTSRLSSSAGGANTRAVRTYYHGDGRRSSFDAGAYSNKASGLPDKGDGYFGFAAFVGSTAFIWLMDVDYHYWRRHDFARPPPRMTPRRGR